MAHHNGAKVAPQWPHLRVGLGTAALGYLFEATSEDMALSVIEAAWDAGIRIFDTAHLYGGGLAEQRLGTALRARRRDDFRLSTKIGCYRPFGAGPIPHGSTQRRAADVWDYGYDRTRAAVETSLQRLGTDRLDIVHLHGFDDHVQVALSEAHRALLRLKEEGVIGAIGAGCDSVAPLLAGLERDAFDTILCAGRYTLLDRSAAQRLIPLAREKRCAVIVAGVFNSGVLATGASAGARFDYSAAAPEILQRVAALEQVCRQHGVALKAAALQFPLRNPAVGTLLIGPANLVELDDSLTHLDAAIPEDFWADADAVVLGPVTGGHA